MDVSLLNVDLRTSHATNAGRIAIVVVALRGVVVPCHRNQIKRRVATAMGLGEIYGVLELPPQQPKRHIPLAVEVRAVLAFVCEVRPRAHAWHESGPRGSHIGRTLAGKIPLRSHDGHLPMPGYFDLPTAMVPGGGVRDHQQCLENWILQLCGRLRHRCRSRIQRRRGRGRRGERRRGKGCCIQKAVRFEKVVIPIVSSTCRVACRRRLRHRSRLLLRHRGRGLRRGGDLRGGCATSRLPLDGGRRLGGRHPRCGGSRLCGARR
mmetsp:Transcript_47396/g.120036  ORF Transcript_47396/g.120036 Transcript_47396/m.120036 type:complete len:264 (-) Transcript_47396:136-927(-)